MIREENASAALEVMSRFAVNPKWLIYLPPTCANIPPKRLLTFVIKAQVESEEKRVGSRAIVII